MSFDTIFFDLDSTLYPEYCGLWQAIRDRIDLYLYAEMKFPAAEIPQIRQNFFVNHGTTLRGLQIHYEVDPLHYLAFVHDLPLSQYLQPDPKLREMLLSIPYQRWIFTNSDAPHANRVLEFLDIQDCFAGMVDVLEMDPLCKPQPEAYQFALDCAGGLDPQNCAFLDDSTRNLAPAKEMGFFTVLVGQTAPDPSADRSIYEIMDLQTGVPELWR